MDGKNLIQGMRILWCVLMVVPGGMAAKQFEQEAEEAKKGL
jgi:hypothetical protein